MLFTDLSHILHRLTISRLPGKDSWKRMAPDLSRLSAGDGPYRKAAVLIMLYPFNDEVYFMLIKRTNDDGPHSGQISLPGGMAEPYDQNLEATALREASEELGVIKEDINIICKLTELLIPVSRTKVSPYIGYLTYTPDFKPNPLEVKYLLPVALEKITDPSIISSEHRFLMEKSVHIPYFQLNGEKVWGATAMILSEFIDFLQNDGQ